MRDLTREELDEYFRFAQQQRESRARPDGFSPKQAETLRDAVYASEAVLDVLDALLDIEIGQPGRIDLLLSVWSVGFQMGRECESRLLDRALKTKVGDAPKQ